MRYIKRVILFVLVCLSPLEGNTQFYNGLQMHFGKNRVQYNDFYWSFYRFEKFDAYFNQFGKNLAQYTALYAEDKLIEIENFFDYSLDKRLIFIVYNKLTDFRQSNIGLVTGSVDDDNIGGVINILDNKVFIFYEGDHKQLEIQINKAITEVILNEMLIGGNIRDRVTNLSMLNLPEWYINGLISYISDEWNIEYENKLKDGLISGKYKQFTKLTEEDAIIAGHSLWRYIGDMYGRSIIPSIVYLTRLNKNSNKAFYNVLGIRMRLLLKEWEQYYLGEYLTQIEDKEFPDSIKVIKRPKKDRLYQNVKVSPNGKYVVYSTNEYGKYKIYLYNIETKKKKKILKNGYKLNQIPDYSYPAIAWHPSSRIVTFITEELGGLKLYFYNIEEKELIKKNFLYLEKVLDFSYSDNGLNFVLSGVKEGQTNLFVHNLAASTNEQLTFDIADDLMPRFTDNSTKIIFSSNRVSDTLFKKGVTKLINKPTYDLFLYDYEKRSNVLIRLTNELDVNNFSAFETKRNDFVYLSDKNGIVNRHFLNLDSTISHIDTAIHYRYFTNTVPLTNYKYNILEHSYFEDSDVVGEIVQKKQRNYIFFNKIGRKRDKNFKKTTFSTQLSNKIIKQDSLRQAKKNKNLLPEIMLPDSIMQILKDTALYLKNPIDINNYIFEKEKRFTFNEDLTPFINVPNSNKDKGEYEFPKIRIYQPSFYSNYLVSQADFGFMSASYQPFSGSGTYFNPGVNGLMKIGTNDLFEDYKLIGGFSISPDLTSNEYLLSFENLKTRIDKQILFHRQSIIQPYENEELGIYNTNLKTHSHNLMYILKFPFNQVKAFKGTINVRHDRNVVLSKDKETLMLPYMNNVWAGLKLEYVFDNTIKAGMNLYHGTRYKIFGEAYKMINERKTDLFVLGFDYRHYEKIHRTLTYAGRFAGSTSFGSAPLLYYLGGVDNWSDILYKLYFFRYNILNEDLNIFNNSIPVDDSKDYAFQTIATNMRGYQQNIRNGNNFFVINNEIRLPIISYFARYPISSRFWSSLQLISFFDIGSAWAGLSPYDKENAYDKITKTHGNISVTVESNRNPIVMGYGYGIRMQLLGYFVRIDKAWGNESLLPHIWHISLSLDF